MSLELDIKTPDASFEKWANETADAIDGISEAEKKANKEGAKSGKDQKATGVHVRKALADHKKTTVEEVKQTKETKAAGTNWKAIGAAVAASAIGIVGLGAEILKLGHDSSRAKEGALSMINAFTEGHGKQTLEYLDQLARKLGLSVKDVRDDWIRFNAAGMTNHMATSLVKTKADLMAMGQSAEQAQGAIDQVLAAGHNNEEAINQLSILKKAFPGVGEGAIAAAYATHSFGAALNRLKDSADLELAKIWDRVGPSLGRAANALSSFIDKSPLIKGMTDDFGKFISEIAKGVNAENLTKAMDTVKSAAKALMDTAHALKDAWDAVNSAIDKATTALANMQMPVDMKEVPQWAKTLDTITNPTKWFGSTPEAAPANNKSHPAPPPGIPIPSPAAAPSGGSGAPESQPQPTLSKPHASLGGGHTFNIYLKGGDDLRQDARTAAQEIQIRLQALGLA